MDWLGIQTNADVDARVGVLEEWVPRWRRDCQAQISVPRGSGSLQREDRGSFAGRGIKVGSVMSAIAKAARIVGSYANHGWQEYLHDNWASGITRKG